MGTANVRAALWGGGGGLSTVPAGSGMAARCGLSPRRGGKS
jgi:hypothetical protein